MTRMWINTECLNLLCIFIIPFFIYIHAHIFILVYTININIPAYHYFLKLLPILAISIKRCGLTGTRDDLRSSATGGSGADAGLCGTGLCDAGGISVRWRRLRRCTPVGVSTSYDRGVAASPRIIPLFVHPFWASVFIRTGVPGDNGDSGADSMITIMWRDSKGFVALIPG